ncbi:methyltransferase [bacterium]|nr:methyltransferase [bacterium]
MTGRELVLNTLNNVCYGRIPRHLWALPWAEEHYPDELHRIQRLFPDDIVTAPAVFKTPPPVSGDRYAPGIYVDEWGCRFENAHGGVIGIVREPLLKDWSMVDTIRTPEEVLTLDIEAVNDFCRATDRFVVAGTWVRPFERLQFIRTMELALMDMALEPPELPVLLKRMHEHYCREVETWCRTDVDAIAIMDDWGCQQGMLISPASFRAYFKPMYREYAAIAASRGKYVFMHSDGNITAIIGDLIECGVQALNSQLFCMDIKELGRKFRGKLTFWGEIDRQHILPRGSIQEVKEAVFTVYENLWANGGIIAQCEFGPGADPANVHAVFKIWDSLC